MVAVKREAYVQVRCGRQPRQRRLLEIGIKNRTPHGSREGIRLLARVAMDAGTYADVFADIPWAHRRDDEDEAGFLRRLWPMSSAATWSIC